MTNTALRVAQTYLSSPELDLELHAELFPWVEAAEKNDPAAHVEINARFSTPLQFGTGGLRGVMSAGLARMNKPTVRRVALAMAEVTTRHVAQKGSVVIGYDTRRQSDSFAREAARVLAAEGYTVYLGNRPLPTPFLCYAMRQLKSSAGMIITASHNPKNYNGLKVYSNVGGQVVAPWDREIEDAMQALPMLPKPPSSALDAAILTIPVALEEAFYAQSLRLLVRPTPFVPAKILYAPFHGTGTAFIPELFRRAGFSLDVCERQTIVDGNFSTAPRPNPEEFEAFAVPLEDAKRLGCEAILATDPDADRLGVLYKQGDEWIQMPGNDMAALALDYLAKTRPLHGALITTVVTSDFLAKVADDYGLPVIWALTGFKHIAAAMQRLEVFGEPFAFAAEESIGLAPSDAVRDKDGVGAALLFAEMLGYYKAQGQTLGEAVAALQARLGIFHNRLINLEDASAEGAARFKAIMGELRHSNGLSFHGETLASVDDFSTGMRRDCEGRETLLLDRPDRPEVALPIPYSDVLKLRFKSGAFIAFRPSGTEPKLKIYLQNCTSVEQLDHMEATLKQQLGLA